MGCHCASGPHTATSPGQSQEYEYIPHVLTALGTSDPKGSRSEVPEDVVSRCVAFSPGQPAGDFGLKIQGGVEGA